MNDSPPAPASGATASDPDLDRLREANRGKGLTIRRTSIGGYRYTITDGGGTPRFVTDVADAQRVIDEDFS